jgi:elongation factor 1-gamma
MIANVRSYATIVKWMSYFNSDVIGALSQWYLPLLGRKPYNKKSVDEAAALSAKVVAPIEEHLLHNTYLAGERISLADFFGASIITRGFQYFYDKEWRAQNPNVSRWYETVINQAVYAEVAEKFELLEKPALTNVAPKTDAPAKEKKEKAPKAPKAEKKPEPEQEEEEEPAAPVEKPKHPLEALPKPAMALDEWKRQYSNKDGPTAMAWFWDNMNLTEDYSLWKVKYKYNSELAMTFMSNNLIGGFNNRLEASRKYLFGASSVFGVNNDSVIEGAFVIRGQEYLPVFDVAPDYESYDFEKLDPASDETKAFLKDMWTEDAPVLTVDGKEYKYASGKVFK